MEENGDKSGLSFGGTRRIEGGITWRSVINGWLDLVGVEVGGGGGGSAGVKTGGLACEIRGILRLDRWLIPAWNSGSQQMASHAIYAVLVPSELKSNFTNVRIYVNLIVGVIK